jgi:hypothetical protein
MIEGNERMSESTTVATPFIPASTPVPRLVFLLLLSVGWLLAFLLSPVLYWKLPPQAETVFLHYTVYFGIDAVGRWSQLLWIPGTGLGIAVFHTIVAVYFRTRHSFITWTAVWCLIVLEVILLSALWLVIAINP